MSRRAWIPLFLLSVCSSAHASIPPLASKHLSARHLNQKQDDPGPGFTPQNFIRPKNAVVPFYQWEENNGYCGEVSSMQAGMNQGQWMSQYNARLICGTGLSQSGPDGFCEANNGTANYNSQFLFENPNPGDAPYANAALCLKNAHLAFSLYDYAHALKGMDGYKQYLSWVKAQVIAGHEVAIAVLNFMGRDAQYDHEVSVTQIGTNHSPTDSTYYDDDVLFFDDHGTGGTPYTQGYTFSSLAKSREGANTAGAHTYSILIPGAYPVLSGTGGDGVNTNPHPITASNYAFSVSGVADPQGVTLPVTVKVTASSSNGNPNSALGVDGFNFETPEVPSDCTNKAPTWMEISLEANVSNLTPGVSYNLYEYDFDGARGFGAAAALAVPESNFNAQSVLAAQTTQFVASSQTYSKTIQTSSDKIIVFRCVRADAP